MTAHNPTPAPTSIKLPEPLKTAVKAHAARMGRSVSAVLRDALVRELREPCSEPTETARYLAQETDR